MDKHKRAIDIVKTLNSIKDRPEEDSYLVEQVCLYFDLIKNSKLNQADLHFLKYVSNKAGIPHYFDQLEKFQEKESLEIENLDLSLLSANIYESTLHTSEFEKLHKFQKSILDKFSSEHRNKYFLSASTSFGKTHLVFEIIKKMNYKNVVLIFPTIALLSENLEKILEKIEYKDYIKHTLSDTAVDFNVANIFIYTPERFLSFIEKYGSAAQFDFVFIDEIYKIDNEYTIDDEIAPSEDERDVSYRIATFYSTLHNSDILLAGPYIESYSKSFNRFLNEKNITTLDFNKYEIVQKTVANIKSKSSYKLDDELSIDFKQVRSGKIDKTISIVNAINERQENCIIYCSRKSEAEKYAREIPKLINYDGVSSDFKNFVNHLKSHFSNDWVVVSALEKGIGIHHGMVPKYIQKEVIRFFNENIIKAMTSTTTITEGVNTTSKNLIVTNNKKGKKPLKRFDAKNIAGRAGRFGHHFSGRVIIINNKFENDLNKLGNEIRHKNYDEESPKDEVDYFYSSDEYLNVDDKLKKIKLLERQKKLNLPDYLFEKFKVVSRSDKMDIYEMICDFNLEQHARIGKLISKASQSPMRLDWEGFQVIINCLVKIVKNKELKALIERKNFGNQQNSLLTVKVSSYLENGFMGLVRYDTDTRESPLSVDKAMVEASKFVFNILKYQLVKYLGVFNVMYKFHRSKANSIPFDDVIGIDRLLTKLEYNALSERGKIASDYGAPEKILKYYEAANEIEANKILSDFDVYEQASFKRLQKIIN